MRRLTTFLIVGALVGATATPALAQVGRTELRGSVTDETGGALPGVTVFIQNEADGTFREVITGGDGSYFAAQLLPGTFTVTAALPGFTTFQTTGFELRVGQTLPLDIILGVGALEETVTVSGQAPLVDLTSAEVGGTLDSQELTEMPLQNRSAFAAISLLPGIQFLPSASGGNDTIIANGQTAASSNLNVDGGYNSDSTSGGAGGSQVKVAIESVQEFQVVSGQFDAEFGRSSGAVINAVTKRGTNQWSGAGFSYSTNTAMTARNFFNQQQFEDDPSTEKPTNNKYEFGGVFGGPIVQDKAHFFFSLERRITNPARAVIFADRGPGLPDLNWSQAENWEAWNTMYRVDHQVNGSNSWALRLMNETSPETNRYGNRTLTSGHDGWDDEHIWVGSYTSVIGNNVVNTVRITRSYENVGGGSPAWWALDGPGLRNGQMRNLTPGYEMDSFSDGIAPWAGGRIDSQWQYNNTTSWFVPDKIGRSRHQVGRHLPPGVHRGLPRELLGRPVPLQHRQAVRRRRLLDLPRTAPDSCRQGERPAVRIPHQHVGGVPAGQVDAERTLDGGARRAVGRRDAERGGDRQSADGAGDRPARLEQHLAALVARLRRDGGRPVRHPGGLRALLRPDALQRTRQRPAGSDLQRLVHRQLPPGGRRPGRAGGSRAPQRHADPGPRAGGIPPHRRGGETGSAGRRPLATA